MEYLVAVSLVIALVSLAVAYHQNQLRRHEQIAFNNQLERLQTAFRQLQAETAELVASKAILNSMRSKT